MSDSIQHTLWIFDRMYKTAPPYFPPEIKEDMKHALEEMRENLDLTIDNLEKTLVVFGKKLWPYRKAFEEFLNTYESRLGEKFLLGIVSRDLRKRYEEFKAHGGSLRDLHSGNPAEFFGLEQRGELCSALIEMDSEIRKHAIQAVHTVDKRAYEKKILEYQLILDDIEKRLDTLRQMADDEQEHPELADEIREQIKSFEYGLCLLGPEHRFEAVCLAEEHFKGRKEEKKVMRR